MRSFLALLLIATLAVCTLSAPTNDNFFPTPVNVTGGKAPTINDVWPVVDVLLKNQYWYYLRNAVTVYQASVNTASTFLFFVIYRNIVGTFLAISTWNKTSQITQVNTLVRLGNGYEQGSGALYSPVAIDPFIITLNLGPGEYMVSVNQNGTITVTGDKSLAATDLNGTTSSFNITADMKEKCSIADKLNRESLWYYLQDADLVSQSDIPTSQQYYCVFVYVNVAGTFLSISHWDLENKVAGVNTFVRLGNGNAPGANYGPVNLTPAVLHMDSFN